MELFASLPQYRLKPDQWTYHEAIRARFLFFIFAARSVFLNTLQNGAQLKGGTHQKGPGFVRADDQERLHAPEQRDLQQLD